MEEEIKFSEWQDGVPPKDGVWQILVNDYDVPEIFYAKFENGLWGSGQDQASWVKKSKFRPYPENNNPNNPRKWRGRLKES